MSRSRKLPICKDGHTKHNGLHKCYRRKIKRRIRQAVRDIKNLTDIESYELPNPKILVCDWDWCDYILDYRWWYLETPHYTKVWKDLDKFYEYMKECYIKAIRK